MHRWTQQLLPPELLGSHIASGRNHTTGRVHDLAFRAGTALVGHLGIEWDLAGATADESAALTEWIALYRELRPLLHGGDLVRSDEVDDARLVYGTVAPDRQQAVFFLAGIGRSEVSGTGRVTFRDLDPDTAYRVDPVVIGDGHDLVRPDWWSGAAGVQRPGARHRRPAAAAHAGRLRGAVPGDGRLTAGGRGSRPGGPSRVRRPVAVRHRVRPAR